VTWRLTVAEPTPTLSSASAAAGSAPRRRQALVKSSKAFRTISEVAGSLDMPQHVLRFWESKFSQVKPLKRGGGRRYYRPEDVALLRRIRHLLYTDGFTIKGVQKILRSRGNGPADLAGPGDGAEVASAGGSVGTPAEPPAVLAPTARPAGASHDEAPSSGVAGAGLRRELEVVRRELEAVRKLLASATR